MKGDKVIIADKKRTKNVQSYFLCQIYCLAYTAIVLLCMPLLAPAEILSSELRIQQFAPRIEIVTFRSKTLQRDKTFSVVLPLGYDKSKHQWSSLFLFHGRGRNEQSLIRDEKARNLLLDA